MKKKIRFLFILFLITSACATPLALEPIQESKTQESEAQKPKTAEERVDALFEQYNKPNSPGVSVAVIHDGEVIYTKGYGMADLEHDIPITPDTVFYIGSTSKQFVAMCILLLEEEGKLSLDDDIREFLPEFPSYDKPILIRHLIHHTSGIRDYLGLWSIAGKNVLNSIPEDEAYDMLCRQKELNFSPGEQHSYSNSGYFLLAKIVREASGKSLRDYADEHIFHPLGMSSSHFHDDVSFIIKSRAFGYMPKPNGAFGNLHMLFSLVGSGGLYTNVKDLFKWDQNFYHNQLGQKRPELIAKMEQDGKLDNGGALNYAFGLMNGNYRGLRTISHGGGLGGYRAEFMRFPDQAFSVILLSNLGTANLQAHRVADIYLEDHFEKQAPGPAHAVVQRKEVSIDPSLLNNYIGRYELSPSFMIDITKEGDQLMAQATGQEKIPLFPESPTKFFIKVVDAQVTFQPDQNQLILHQGGANMPAKRIEKVTFTSEQMDEYTGDYYSEELLVTYRIMLESNTLYLKVGYRPKVAMQTGRKDMFGAGIPLRFMRDDQDEIVGFEIDAGRVQNLKFYRQ